MSRGRKPLGLREEIRRVIKASPGVPLNRDAIGSRVKVAAGRTRLTMTLANMRIAGELVSARDDCEGVVYIAGPKLRGSTHGN